MNPFKKKEEPKPVDRSKKPQKYWSAFEDFPVGCEDTFARTRCKLGQKARISFDLCPVCHSRSTFHSSRTSGGQARHRVLPLENITHMDVRYGESCLITRKYDLCLRCGHEWCCELYVWEYQEKQKWTVSGEEQDMIGGE